ncbi:uncharacterized protein RJT20DRAFT_130496 [Scheffersomyces xylosifermentans]|uniref:uncharacterized protein n=1 Tax=Scheffersomyces xylosifermentans TaxID=1304137 RepID=UPI00315DF3D1
MSSPGFDWMKLPPPGSASTASDSPSSGTSSPAPPVSFGTARTASVSTTPVQSSLAVPATAPNLHPSDNNVHNYIFRNNSADDIMRRGAAGSSLEHSSNHRSVLQQYNNVKNESSTHITHSENNSFDSFIPNSRSTTNSFSNNDSESDLAIPLSLTAQELTLQESKTYMRWYSDILARTNSRTITLNDVFSFLNNFKIPTVCKEKIQRIFQKIVQSINIGEFFALLRMISHTLSGQEPSRKLLRIKAPIPTPPSILSKKRQNDDDNESDAANDVDEDSDQSAARNGATPENKPLDIDSFTQFMLTGERPDDIPKKKRSKKLKSVKFSDQIVTDIHDDSFMGSPIASPSPQLDYSLPMDQLLERMKQGGNITLQQQSQSQQQQQQQIDEEEQEVLKDMESQINHFRNLHSVDTASIGGVPSSIHFHDGNSSEHLLRPNMTGPAQMAMFNPSPEPELLKPNMTGPAQMAKFYNSRLEDNVSPSNGPASSTQLFGPSDGNNNIPSDTSQGSDLPRISLQSFTSQMTGNTLSNTLQNARVTNDGSPRSASGSFSNSRPLPPPPVPTSRRNRSASSPMPSVASPLPAQSALPQTSPLSHQFTVSQYEGSNGPTNSGPNLSAPVMPPPVPPRSPLGGFSANNNMNSSPIGSIAATLNGQRLPPPPPPSRRRNTSTSSPQPPPLPPKVSIGQNGNSGDIYNSNNSSLENTIRTNTANGYNDNNGNNLSQTPAFYGNETSNGSTANILDDLKALQAEVDKIRDMTGGF